jgi:uncharacterized protein (TIGR03067 family)
VGNRIPNGRREGRGQGAAAPLDAHHDQGRYLIRGNGGFSVESKIAIDPSKHPKAIDLVTRLPGGGSETAVGIYELSGESLKICYDATGKQRPKEFKSAEGSTVVLSILKRPK